ncbi:phosphoglucosamine mutase, partial [Candidatus Woesearchaeota archaeon]|nr:phosphoglucosamine mutase [Candidatus Woesearchaeota archaeon]
IGIALDGDADRVIIVDEKGDEIDGDHIIAMCAIDMKDRGKLKNSTVVVTVMTNIGFDIAMKEHGIDIIKTKVGDRYVVEEMRKNNHSLGGEQSGHIIFFDRSTTGDGTLSALHVLALMKDSGKQVSELAKVMTSYPQILINVKVKQKKPIQSMLSVCEAISNAEKKLGDQGRVLVRYSGTENKCRVMVEGKDQEEISSIAESIVSTIKEEIGE